MPTETSDFAAGLAAAEAGDFARAEAIAAERLKRDRNDIGGLQIIGYANFRRGRNHEALNAFIAAQKIAPGQPAILNWIGILMKERGDFAQALAAFDDAVRAAPESAELRCNLGETLALMGRREDAARAYDEAIAIAPPQATPLAKAARFFERAHDLDRAQDCAARALELEPDNETALIAMAEVAARRRRHAEIIALLAEPAAAASANPRNQSKMFRLLADAYDRSGDYERAFDAYAAANNLQAALYGEAAARERNPCQPQTLARLLDFFAREDFAGWTTQTDLEGPAPVFLLGFMRSGTTWLDQILSSHPGVAVMEEEDNFVDSWREFLLTDAGLRQLRALPRAEIEHYRKAYWRRAEARLDARNKDGWRGRLVVDKVPLNTVQIALIRRLFPEAKFIFAVRDPRDCVLSAFQQHFAITAATAHFLSLDTAAAFYDQVMRLSELYRRGLPLDLREVRYEDLVADLEGETRGLLDFLGLDWAPAVLAYDETARARNILTVSARQVIEKPYATSIGKWRRYETQMAPALPLLDKWAAHYGYAPR